MANDALGDDFTDCCNFMRKIFNTILKANKPGGKDWRGIGATNTGKGKLTGLVAKSYQPREWNKFSTCQKTHVWTLRGYDPGDIDSCGNLKKGSQKKSGNNKNNDSINLLQKQVAMIAAQIAHHISATSNKEVAGNVDSLIPLGTQKPVRLPYIVRQQPTRLVPSHTHQRPTRT
jgi:hypothetical protein